MKKYLFQAVNFFLLFSFMVSNSPLYAAQPKVVREKEKGSPSFITKKKQEITGEMKRLIIELQKLVEIGKNIDKGIKVPVGYFVLTLEGIVLIISEIVQLMLHPFALPAQYYLHGLSKDSFLGLPPFPEELDEASLQEKFEKYAQSKAFKRLMRIASKVIVRANNYIILPIRMVPFLLALTFLPIYHLLGIILVILRSIPVGGSQFLFLLTRRLLVAITKRLGIRTEKDLGRVDPIWDPLKDVAKLLQ